MGNPFGIPEMSVTEVARKRAAGEEFVLLDVRELHELEMASIGEGVEVAPMSELVGRRLEALPESAQDVTAEIVVMCHHGNRSAQVAAWLRQQGWSNVYNMTGGIEAWANEVDPAVGYY